MKKSIAIVCSVLALFLLTCCSSSGSGDTDPGNTDPGNSSFETMIRKVLAGDAQGDDWFGFSVSISGDYAIVGAYNEDGGGTDAGAAYVFHRTGNDTWDSGVKLVAPDAQAGDIFGCSVAINGDYAVVGAYSENGGSGDPLFAAGAAYIFHRTGDNTWDNGVKLVAPDAEADALFGNSVAISGDYAIVGECADDDFAGFTPLSAVGAAYIFHRTGDNSWDSGVKLVAPDAQALDWFGQSVSISGEYAIVGAYMENGGAGDPLFSAGAAYIFHRIGDTWDGGVKLVAPDAQASDYFGCSVAISGEYAIVGAHSEDGGAGDPRTEAGAAYIFHRTGSSWDSGVKLVSSDTQASDYFGYSVAISGEYAIVGARSEDGGAGDPLSNAGATYIFHRTGYTWDSGVKLGAPDAQVGDQFGYSVAISGEYAIVGARYEDGGTGDPCTDAGAAYIFQ